MKLIEPQKNPIFLFFHGELQCLGVSDPMLLGVIPADTRVISTDFENLSKLAENGKKLKIL